MAQGPSTWQITVASWKAGGVRTHPPPFRKRLPASIIEKTRRTCRAASGTEFYTQILKTYVVKLNYLAGSFNSATITHIPSATCGFHICRLDQSVLIANSGDVPNVIVFDRFLRKAVEIRTINSPWPIPRTPEGSAKPPFRTLIGSGLNARAWLDYGCSPKSAL